MAVVTAFAVDVVGLTEVAEVILIILGMVGPDVDDIESCVLSSVIWPSIPLLAVFSVKRIFSMLTILTSIHHTKSFFGYRTPWT